MLSFSPKPGFIGRDSRITLLPAPHCKVGFTVDAHDDCDTIEISYYGTREAMVAAGAAPEWVVARKKRGKLLVDELGDVLKFSSRRKTWEVLTRWKDAQTAIELPGVTKQHVDRALEKARAERAKLESDCVAADVDGERNEARYRAEELAIRALRRMPAKGFPSTEEALRYLGDLRDLLELAITRRGARGEIVACLADQISLSQTVRFLDNLPTYAQAIPNRAERYARHLRLVVDNTRENSNEQRP
jgi:hypothetical protein